MPAASQWMDRVGRRLKLRDLHVLLAVAECRSMAKAALQLAITPPVVSKTISDLEQTLGVPLFDRSPQGVELTTYGQALRECGIAVFDEMRQGLKKLEYLADPSSGELRIGCPDIMVAGVLPPLAQRFMHEHPRVRLQIVHEDSGNRQFHHLRERNAELFIARLGSPLVDEDLMVEDLFDEAFLAYVGVTSPWAKRRRIELADLIDEPWVLPPYASVPGTLIADIFRAGGLAPPQPAIETLSAHLSAVMVGTGNFVGMLPVSVLHFHARRFSLKALPVVLPDKRIRIAIVTLKNRTLSRLAELFIDCARQISRPLLGPQTRERASRRRNRLDPTRELA